MHEHLERTSPRDNQHGQMHFTCEVTCAEFVPNRFRKNFCVVCQSKIQQHSGAKPEHVVAALEYSVDKGSWVHIDNLTNKYISNPIIMY